MPDGPFSPLNSKLEQAFVALLAARIPTATISAGESNSAKSPDLICQAGPEPGEEYPEQTGNYWVNVEIIVRSLAPIDADGVDTKPAHDLLVGTVDYWLSQSDLFAQLNAACAAAVPPIGDFTAQFQEWLGFGSNVLGECWEASAHLRVYCCASTLGA